MLSSISSKSSSTGWNSFGDYLAFNISNNAGERPYRDRKISDAISSYKLENLRQ